MALAWVQRSDSGDQQVFKVEAGGNRFFELFLTTEPELMQPRLAPERGPDNFYSSRQEHGTLMPLNNGQALFPLPEIVQRRFAGSDVYYMVKTFRNEQGDSPALSPVMSGTDGQIVMSQVDPTEGAMRTLDYERVLADLGQPTNGNGSRPRPTATGQRARTTAPTRAAPPARAASTTRQSHQMNSRQAEIDGLALVCRRLQAMSAADPMIPGRPSFSDVAAIVTQALAHVPAPDPRGTAGMATAASFLTGGSRGHASPAASQAALHRAVMRAHSRLSHNNGYSKAADFGISAILATLGPVLLQALPALLPIIMPAIQGLLQNLIPKAKSASETATTAATPATPVAATPAIDPAMLQKLLMSLIPSAAATPAAGGATSTATPGGATTTPPAAGGTAPQATPEQVMALLGALQGAGGAAGGGLALPGTGGTGAAILKSVVDRLPIEKMFDGQAWLPKSSHDEWIKTLPWDKVLSFSDPAATIGALLLPGRADLQPLRDVKLSIVNRTLTRLDGGHKSWIFVADRPAQLQLEIVAGRTGLERPFVDVRVSVDGTSRSGIQRSVFRLPSMSPGERRIVPIELPADVLMRAPTDGRETCVSLRVIEQQGDTYSATETRCCLYVVLPHSLVIDPSAVMREAPQLAELPGLELTIPPLGQNPTLRMLDWTIRVGTSAEVAANARYLPVQLRITGQGAVVSGGLEFSPAGLADMARRGDAALGIEGFTALTAAIDSNAALRERMSLMLREPIEPATLARGSGSLRVRVEMGGLPASLVTFSGTGPDGNPIRRDVREVQLPVPRGIATRVE